MPEKLKAPAVEPKSRSK